jgi:RHS repeat-associated protein
VTPPLPAQPLTFTYERSGTSDSYLHTSRAVHLQTDGANVIVEKRYDENFRTNAVIQQDGTASPLTTTLEYWPVGLLRTVRDPRNFDWTTSYTYTARNQMETVTNALNHRTSFHYDPAGNMDYIDRPDAKRETRTYDEMNRVVTAIEPVTGTTNKTTKFTYWPSGRVKTVEDDNHQITRFDYDNWDRQQFMFYPDNTFQRWDYDGTGVLRGHRTVGGKTQLFSADSRNRITGMSWDQTNNVYDWAQFEYDAASQLIGAINPNGTIRRQYDDAGRLLSEEQNVYGLGAKTVTYVSDGAGKRTALGLTGTDYQFGYDYDTLGRLDQLLDVQSSASGPTASPWYQYSYDAASNQIQRFCTLNGVAQMYGRDALGRIGDLKAQNTAAPKYPGTPQPGGGGGVPLLTIVPTLIDALVNNALATLDQAVPEIGTVINSEHYTYDTMSRVTNVQGSAGNDTFAYDYSGQLSAASYSNWNNAGTRSVSYAQDNLGNRSQVNDSGNVQGYSPMANYRNQYASAPAGAVSNGNEHEIAGYQGLSYTYIGDRHLASITGNGSSYALAYDALGRCVKRTLNGTTIYYTYDGPHPIYEWKADGTVAGWNLYGQGIDEILLRGDYVVVANGQGYFYQQNRLGSVTHLTGFAGEVIESYRYDAYGQPTTTYTGGSFNNRFKFTGREYQPAFGIYEYRNRAYHPGLGRFLSEDPMGFAAGDTNLYRYCNGDPVNSTDPFGLDSGNSRVPKKKDGEDGSENSGGANNYYGGQSYEPGSGSTFYGDTTDLFSVSDGPISYGNYDLNRMSGPVLGGDGLGITGAGDVSAGSDGRGGGTSRFANGASLVGGPGDTLLGNGTAPSPQFSGVFTVTWWPKMLTLPYTTPPTAEQAAWTDTGRGPTLVAATLIFGGLAIPETAAPLIVSGANVISTGADAAAAWTANQIYLHPYEVWWLTAAANQFISPSGPMATSPEVSAALFHTPFLTPWIFPDLGP